MTDDTERKAALMWLDSPEYINQGRTGSVYVQPLIAIKDDACIDKGDDCLTPTICLGAEPEICFCQPFTDRDHADWMRCGNNSRMLGHRDRP